VWDYRGTSLIRNRAPPGPYSRTMPRALWKSQGGAFSDERGTPGRFGVGDGRVSGVGCRV